MKIQKNQFIAVLSYPVSLASPGHLSWSLIGAGLLHVRVRVFSQSLLHLEYRVQADQVGYSVQANQVEYCVQGDQVEHHVQVDQVEHHIQVDQVAPGKLRPS